MNRRIFRGPALPPWLRRSVFAVVFWIALGGLPLAHAGPARAQWLDDRHLILKMPQGLQPFSDMRFFLSDNPGNSWTLAPTPAWDLPVVSSGPQNIVLSTSGIPRAAIDQLIRQPLKVYTTNSSGQIMDATAIQYAGLLDQLYASTDEDLGVTSSPAGNFTVKVWAPTARQVRLFLYPSADTPPQNPEGIFLMERSPQGVWSTPLPGTFRNAYYLYEVQVFQPTTDRIETNLVTDPYSLSLSVNGTKSQLADPNDPAARPPGWEDLQKPVLNSPNDAVLYELHIRDFSVGDLSMPFMYRGSYLAFTQASATAVRHLQSLAEAGLTHVHLLPFNDFATVNEDKSQWQTYTGDGGGNLQETQSIIGRIRDNDSYNWGYDPVHYMAPEGSYALEPAGLSRLREVRGMIQALNQMGLRVVQDVVFNHTYRNGLQPYSVFDKIVPLYYYRMNDEGDVYNSSCCADTASEHTMMTKLMVDSVVAWARNFKIDGFRFDLMSFHTHETMIRIREALRQLTVANDGVDGSKILIYGEGWPFGSLFDRDPAASANLLNSYGLGIGFFNDRLRDAVRGGTTNSAQKSDQGFVTGLYFDFNQEPANRDTPPDLSQQRDKLLQLGDVIKAGLAANLRDYGFRGFQGSPLHGSDIEFRGEAVANAAQALETINYVSAHDGYTLWDAVQAKAPFYTPGRSPALMTVTEKQRMHQMALSFPLLGEGIPFIEGGSEVLRSKNGDQDSYDSGDFFNQIDWTGTDNQWGRALPPAWGNYDDWSFWTPRLLDPGTRANSAAVQATDAYLKALLRLRRSEPLFHLNSLADVSRHLSFIDNDAGAEPGLIAMLLRGTDNALLVFFNASRETRTFSNPYLKYPWFLHPLFNQQIDPVLSQVHLNAQNQSIVLPGRSTVILKLTAEHARLLERPPR